MDKHGFLRSSLLRAGGCYFLGSVIYLALVAGTTGGTAKTGALASLLLTKLLVLAGFALVFGFSYFIFDTRLGKTAARTLHLVGLMICWVVVFMLMGSVVEGFSGKLLNIIVAIAIYLVAYPLGMLVHSLIKKIK